MSALPPDWRDRLVGALTLVDAPSEAVRDWLVDGARRPERQVEIYRDQIGRRLIGSLRRQFPGIAHRQGDRFEPTGRRYLREHPPSHWSLYTLGDALPAWLEAQGAPRDERDLARLDLAVGHAQRQPAPIPLGPVEPTATLTLSRGVTLLHLGRPWQGWRRAVAAGASVEDPSPAPTDVVVYLRDGQVRDQQLAPLEARILGAFREESTLAEALGDVAASLDNPAPLVASLPSWFARFGGRGWLCRVDQ